MTSPHAATYVAGVLALSRRQTPFTPTQLNTSSIVQQAPAARIFGTAAELNRPLSWWDLFTWWHVAAMSWPTPGGGNRAHGGPIFAPWHRLYLRRLEEAIQAATGDRNFGLPYWDWAADGELAPAAQLAAPIWATVGPVRGEITTGPFGALRVRLIQNPADNRVYVVPARPIWRAAGRSASAPTLPTAPNRRACSPTPPTTGRRGTSPPTASATSSKAGATRRTPAPAAAHAQPRPRLRRRLDGTRIVTE